MYTFGDKVIDILEKTNLNWQVEKEQLYRANGIKTDTYGVFRKDNGNQLNQVKSSYQVYQNFQLVEDLVNVVGDHLNIENANTIKGGSLQGGRKIFLQFPIEEVGIKNDIVKRYLTFINSHDGSTTVGIGSSNIVVSCANTFFAAHKGMSNKSKFKHSIGSLTKIKDLTDEMSEALNNEQILIDKMRRLVDKPIVQEDIEQVKRIVLGTIPKEASTRLLNLKDKLDNSINKELVAKGMDKWGLFNGVTYYNTHEATNGRGDYNTMFGQGLRTNNQVLDYLNN